MLSRKVFSPSLLSKVFNISQPSYYLTRTFTTLNVTTARQRTSPWRSSSISIFTRAITTKDSADATEALIPEVFSPPPKPKPVVEEDDEEEGITVPAGVEEVEKTPDGKEWEYFDPVEEEKKKEGSLYELFLGEAKAGDVGAMHSVGKILVEGGGNMKKGLEWLHKAVDGGHTGALSTLGQAYQAQGDDEKALIYFRKAYKKGNENAAWNLGTIYMKGVNGVKELEEAYKWFMIAAERGNEDAMYNVGLFYLRGLGVEKDLIYAREWLMKAATKGSDKAQKTMEDVNMVPKRKR